MSDAARLAREAYKIKPDGVPYSLFVASTPSTTIIRNQIPSAIIDTSYAAIISYVEAITGLKNGLSSWGVIRLYYSSYYSIKSMLLAGDFVPFNSDKEMILDVSSGKFYKGGKSSHNWNWALIRNTLVRGEWFFSQDSQEAYEKLRKHRENVNYTHCFTDPNIHECLNNEEMNFDKRFANYRDDDEFMYTYLDDHLSIAYPTKLIFALEKMLETQRLKLDSERVRHIKTLWKMHARCPLT